MTGIGMCIIGIERCKIGIWRFITGIEMCIIGIMI